MSNFTFRKYFIERYVLVILLLLISLIMIFVYNNILFFLVLIFLPFDIFILIRRNVRVNRFLENKQKYKIEKDLRNAEYKYCNYYFLKNYIFSMDKEVYLIKYSDIKVIDSETSFPLKEKLLIDSKKFRFRLILKLYDNNDKCFVIETPYFKDISNNIKEFILNKNDQIVIGSIKYFKKNEVK